MPPSIDAESIGTPIRPINSPMTLQHPARMDREGLSLALATNSATTIARQFAVTPGTVYRWGKALGITRRVYRCPDPQLLRRLENDGHFQKEIARTFGVSRWTIWRWCREFNIAHHTTGQFRKGTKGNLPHIHEEMPIGIGVLFDVDF
jgi:DNA invertase Pin-like site-specific DNA recombinase